jgi:hypothetical protein
MGLFLPRYANLGMRNSYRIFINFLRECPTVEPDKHEAKTALQNLVLPLGKVASVTLLKHVSIDMDKSVTCD